VGSLKRGRMLRATQALVAGGRAGAMRPPTDAGVATSVQEESLSERGEALVRLGLA